MLHLPDVSMPDPGPPETPDETAETSDDDRENTAEPVPHSSSSHWEWRPEYEVSPPEPGNLLVTRRRIVAKRPPTGDEEEEIRQKRLRSEPVPELFPLTAVELSEDVFEILIELFASLGSEHSEDSRVSAYSEDSRVSAYSEDSRVSAYCEDSRVSAYCEDSRVSAYCEDSRVSAYCEDSRVSAYCEDSRVSAYCEDSRVSAYCEDSRVSAYCEGSRGSKHCEGSRVLEAHVCAQDRDRVRPCKGNEPCTSYSRTFTIHNYGYGIAYTFTHNNITLEHTAMNDKNTIAHMDVLNTQY